MRISDWSSDVCSSDLLRTFLHFDLSDIGVAQATDHALGDLDAVDVERDRLVAEGVRIRSGNAAARDVAALHAAALRRDDELRHDGGHAVEVDAPAEGTVLGPDRRHDHGNRPRSFTALEGGSHDVAVQG